MIIHDILPYLNGKQFSSGVQIDLSGIYKELTRIEFLVHLCRQKRIIHLGCTDHVSLIDEKIRNNQWLHKLLTDVSLECIGVDIDKESIDYVRKLGYQNVICGDMAVSPLPEITSQKWDFLVLGEILEHVDNPVSFLKDIKNNYMGSIDKVVVTVPNILSLFYYNKMKKGFEFTNTDHRYWFTPYTILKVILQSGIIPTDISYCNRMPLSKYHLALRKIRIEKKKYPFFYFQTLAVTGKLKENE
jgi:hypothetical protein